MSAQERVILNAVRISVKANGCELREHFWDFPYLQGERVFQTLVSREGSFGDFFGYIADTKTDDPRKNAKFCLSCGRNRNRKNAVA